MRHAQALLLTLTTSFALGVCSTAHSQVQPATAVGRTAGQFAVSQTGAATYTIPLWIPPGVAGVQPELSLTYNSQGGGSLISEGWSISGMSQISRCQRTFAQDGFASPVLLTTADAFCIDGQRLSVTSGPTTYGQPDSTYQTEVADFTLVTAKDSVGGAGPAWFEVKSNDGLIFEYGNSVDSRSVLPGMTVPHSWALSKVRDRENNNMVIIYAQSNGTVAPVEIRYTQAPAAGATYPYSVVFTYASRDPEDRTSGYALGAPFSVASRLATIDMRHGGSTGTVVRTYRLTYADSPTTGRSRLTAVQECATEGGSSCRAPTTIAYQDGQAGVPNPDVAGGTIANSFHRIFRDISGDGRTDALYSVTSGSNQQWWALLAQPGGGYSTPINTGVLVGTDDDVLVDDFTGSGQLALLAPASGVWHLYRYSGGSFIATSTGLVVDPNRLLAPNPADGRFPSFASADVDGDGLADLVWAASVSGVKSIYTRRNTMTGGALSFASTAVNAYPIPGQPQNFAGVYGSNTMANSQLQRMDFNADGREDVVMGTWSTNQIGITGAARQLISQNTAFATGPSVGNFLGAPQALNWNDDACTDLLGTQVHVSGCNGTTGLLIATAGGGGVLIDWDGDGRTDLLAPIGSSEWQVQLSTGTSVTAAAPTGIPVVSGAALIPVDHNADGLTDLVSWDLAGVIRIGLHRAPGTHPDLVSEIVDGFGISSSVVYGNLGAGGVHEATYPGLAAPTFPECPYNGALNVVSQITASDGTGAQYQNIFRYYAARKDLQGRGFKGFAAKRIWDSRNGHYLYQEYRQDFPFIGALAGEKVRQQNDSTLVRSLVNTYDKTVLSTLSGNRREFVFLSESVAKSYELGGAFNGAHVLTRTTTNTFDSWGTLTNQVVTTTEVSTGLNPGATHMQSTYLPPGTVVNDTANWCLNRPTEMRRINSHSLTGGGQLVRVQSQAWDLPKCRVTEEVTEPGDQSWQVTTSFGYDAFGNVASVTTTPAAGQGQMPRTTLIDWGTSGQFPRTVTNPKSQVTTIDWDVQKGVQTEITDPNAVSTQWQYDAFGQVKLELNPDGTKTEFWLGGGCAGSPVCGAPDLRWSVLTASWTTTDELIRVHLRHFDGFDRLRVDAQQGLADAPNTDALNTVITTYDAFGRIASRSTPATSADPVWFTSYTYDLRGRLVEIERQTSEADTSPRQTLISYEGLRTVTTDPLGRLRTVARNGLGQIIQVLNAAGHDTEYEYDAFGNLLKTRDVLGNETTATYNVRGMRIAMTDPDMGAWTYDYFPLGELESQTTALNHTTMFTYDGLSRPLTRVEPEGTTTWTWDTTANGVGLLHSVESPGPSAGNQYRETHTYDSLGRLTRTTFLADGTTYLADQSYSATTGLPETLTYPTSTAGVRFKLRYGYQHGLLQNITDFTGDVAGTVYWQAVAANARGQIIDEQLGNGLRTISSYDRIAGWLETRTSGPGGGTARQNVEYNWNKVGSLIERRELNLNLIETFYYDPLDRLDYSQLNGVTNLDMAYDALGNITSKTGVGSYTYHATKKHAVIAAGTNTYTYDANGNMITRNGATITWSSYNLPTSINQAGGNFSQFLYGADRARYKHITQSATGVETTIHIRDLFERLTRGSTIEYKHYIRGPDGIVALYNRKTTGTNETVYLLKDHLGTPLMLTNSGGFQITRLSNDAFGRRRNGGTWSGNNASSSMTAINNTTHRGFTGHEHLDNVGLVHMNGRVYDPVLGRFLSADPFVQAPHLDQSLNRYSYTLNNPLSYTDPTGYFWDWDNWFDFDFDWDFGWDDWFGGGSGPRSSCSPAGSDFCRRWSWFSQMFAECGLNARCRDAYRTRNPPPSDPGSPPTPVPPANPPGDRPPPVPDPDPPTPDVPVPGPADGVAGLGSTGGGSVDFQRAIYARATAAIDDARQRLLDTIFAPWRGWDNVKDHARCLSCDGWPGDGSLEANLAGLPPIIGGPIAAARGINVTERGLAHVLARHTAGGASTAGKSLFNVGEDAAALVRNASSVQRVQQARGNFERVVDAGRTIGVDRVTGQPTSIYTVITNAADDLITAFPGRP